MSSLNTKKKDEKDAAPRREVIKKCKQGFLKPAGACISGKKMVCSFYSQKKM